MKKGDILEGIIEEVKFPNRGILHADGLAVEVKNVIPGQRVRVRITKRREKRAEAVLLEVLEKAPDEVEAPCPAFGCCGGCTYLNLSYHKELTLKQLQVMELLQQGLDEGRRLLRAGAADQGQEKPEGHAGSEAADGMASLDSPVRQEEPWMHVQTWYEGIHSSPRIFGYRNKMEFTFGDETKGGPLTLGMHRRGSFHDIVDAGDCVIVDEDFRAIVRATRDFFAGREVPFYHRFSQTGYLRHLLVRKAAHTGEILVDLVTTSTTSRADEQAEVESAAEPAAVENGNTSAARADQTAENSREKALLEAWADMLEKLPLEGKLVGILHTRNDSLADVVENQGTEVLAGKSYFEEELLHLKFVVTPFSFFQTNSYSAETLYTIVRQYIQKVVRPVYGKSVFDDAGDSAVEPQTVRKPVIYDLYCGTGTISQLVAPVASRVIGVEIVEEAVQAARENARRNGVANCSFLAGDVLKVLDNIEEKPDLIILDPPRDGIHPKALPKILRYGVAYILYISCKPTSLARDLPAFLAAGYRPVEGCSVDQFVWSGNVETVVLLQKRTEKS